MITDYSSTMFDYAILRKPMIFYAYDYEEYIYSERGSYFELKSEAPGEVVSTQEELQYEVGKLFESNNVSSRFITFVKKYCGDEDGASSRRAVDYIWQTIESGANHG